MVQRRYVPSFDPRRVKKTACSNQKVQRHRVSFLGRLGLFGRVNDRSPACPYGKPPDSVDVASFKALWRKLPVQQTFLRFEDYDPRTHFSEQVSSP